MATSCAALAHLRIGILSPARHGSPTNANSPPSLQQHPLSSLFRLFHNGISFLLQLFNPITCISDIKCIGFHSYFGDFRFLGELESYFVYAVSARLRSTQPTGLFKLTF